MRFRRGRRLAHCLGWSLLGLPAIAIVAQEDTGTEVPGREDAEFMELLEFIGEFTTEDGRWVDPMELEEGLGAVEEDDINEEDVEEEQTEEPVTGNMPGGPQAELNT